LEAATAQNVYRSPHNLVLLLTKLLLTPLPTAAAFFLAAADRHVSEHTRL
jgi:hypothetical protein